MLYKKCIRPPPAGDMKACAKANKKPSLGKEMVGI
jgi:hypothetical protein